MKISLIDEITKLAVQQNPIPIDKDTVWQDGKPYRATTDKLKIEIKQVCEKNGWGCSILMWEEKS